MQTSWNLFFQAKMQHAQLQSWPEGSEDWHLTSMWRHCVNSKHPCCDVLELHCITTLQCIILLLMDLYKLYSLLFIDKISNIGRICYHLLHSFYDHNEFLMLCVKFTKHCTEWTEKKKPSVDDKKLVIEYLHVLSWHTWVYS